MKTHHLTTPLKADDIANLKPGDKVVLSGTIYTARDAAHKRLTEALLNHQPLPFDLQDQIIYYCGPTPPRPGYPIGSAGPTTSGRMDKYTPLLLENGLKGMIGKGNRSDQVVQQISSHQAIYFTAIGGAGAYYARTVRHSECIAYEDLGAEAIFKLDIENFICYVSLV